MFLFRAILPSHSFTVLLTVSKICPDRSGLTQYFLLYQEYVKIQLENLYICNQDHAKATAEHLLWVAH